MKKPTDDLLKSLQNAPSFDDYLNENSDNLLFDSLPDWIEYHMLRKGLKKADVIRRSGIQRNYAYQVINGTRHPSRDTLIMLCFGLELTLDDANQILKKNAFPALYPRDLRDSVIIFGLTHRYSIVELDMLLEEKGLKEMIKDPEQSQASV